jgi:hypothetical protein
MSLTIAEDGAVTLSDARQSVCLESAWEIDALATLLSTLIPRDDENLTTHFHVRCVASRIRTLSFVIMAGLGDIVEETKNLKNQVFVKHECEA